MHELIKEIRAYLSFQQALMGNLIFLPDPGPDNDVPPRTQTGSAAPARGKAAGQTTTTSMQMSSSEAVEQFSAKPGTGAKSHTAYERILELIPEDSPVKDINSLEELEEHVRHTVVLPIDSKRLNPVFGVGNPDAGLMLIGEAPGADEDRQGEPFVGRAGMLLNKILEAIEFDRKEVYIANILKSRPPDNRNPLPDEIAAHIPFLYKQIALIQPRLILALGKVSASALLQSTDSLGQMRGKFHDYHGIPLLVTYHPAALLRNPHWKRPTWEDVQMLREKYDELVKSD